MSDLKPCPFCGNAPAREKDGEYHVICCSGCRAEVSSTSKRELDALWDRRAAALEGDAGELERLREALRKAEAALADIGDADREPGDDLAWCEARAAEALPVVRAALAEGGGE